MKKLTNPHEAELDEMREIFSLVDKDGGGTISNEELSELFSIVGIEASDEDLDEMIRQMDEDNSGEIDFEGESVMRKSQVQIVIALHITLRF
jgi:calmodulin